MANVQAKWKELVAKVFGGDEAQATQFVQGLEVKDAKIAAAGVKFKAAAEEEKAEGENKKGAEVEQKAHDEVPEKDQASEGAEGEAQEEVTPIGESSVGDFEQMMKELGDYIIGELKGHVDNTVGEQLKAYHGTIHDALQSAVGARTKEASQIAQLDARLKALEGEAPANVRNRFRASQDGPAPSAQVKEAQAQAFAQPTVPQQLTQPQYMDELTYKMMQQNMELLQAAQGQQSPFAPGVLPNAPQ